MNVAENTAVHSLVEGFFHFHPDDAARLLEGLPAGEIVRLLEAASTNEAAAVLERLSSQSASQALAQMREDNARKMMEVLDPDRTAPLLMRMEEEDRNRLLQRLSPSAAREHRQMMAYPPDSAGQLMDPRVVTFRDDSTVETAVERLRGVKRKRIHEVFLVDGEGHLVGFVPLQEIVMADREERLDALAKPASARVLAVAGREEVVEILDQHKLTTLPVVDLEGRLLGVIRYDALVHAVEQEASADILSMVGASPEERALSGVWFAVRKRLPWLQINLATAFLAASVVGIFEGTIAKFTALAVLLPVVAGQSGNTGAQALAVAMRGLALREVRLRHWPRLTYKEARVGAINGIAVAAVTSLGVYVWSGSAGLGLVIGLSMVISMVLAGVAGIAVPMLLDAVGQDPAQSSSIILTTVTDITGFFSFLGLATLFSYLL